MSEIGQKRELDSYANGLAPKKRLVWPDDLHKEFVLAVFDAGLKHLVGNPEDAWEPVIKAHKKATKAQIIRHVQKLLSYRVNEKRQKMRLLEQSSAKREDDKETAIDESIESAEEGSSINLGPTDAELAETYKILDDAKELYELEERYKVQLEVVLQKQSELFKKLSEKAHQIGSMRQSEMHSTKEAGNPNSLKTQDIRGKSSGSFLRSNRSENQVSGLSIINEMKENIEMHRRLLLQKEEMLSRHGSSSDLHQEALSGGLRLHKEASLGQSGVPSSSNAPVTAIRAPIELEAQHYVSGGLEDKSEAQDLTVPFRRSKEVHIQGLPRALSGPHAVPVAPSMQRGVSTSSSSAISDVGLPLRQADKEYESQTIDFDRLDMDQLFGFLNDPDESRF